MHTQLLKNESILTNSVYLGGIHTQIGDKQVKFVLSRHAQHHRLFLMLYKTNKAVNL